MPLQNWLKFRVRGVCMLLESILEVSVRLCIVFIYLMLFECRGIIQCTIGSKATSYSFNVSTRPFLTDGTHPG